MIETEVHTTDHEIAGHSGTSLRMPMAKSGIVTPKIAIGRARATYLPGGALRRCTVEKLPDFGESKTIGAMEGQATVIGTLTCFISCGWSAAFARSVCYWEESRLAASSTAVSLADYQFQWDSRAATPSVREGCMNFGSRGQRSIAKRFPLVVMLSCAILSVVLRTALRSEGQAGQITRVAAIGFATISIVAATHLFIKFRSNDRQTDGRIDQLLAERVQPKVRYQDDR